MKEGLQLKESPAHCGESVAALFIWFLLTHLALVVGAGQGLTRRGGAGRLQDVAVVRPAALRVSLQDFHEVGDEEIVLQGRHALLWQDGGLSAHWAGQRQRLGRDVVL